MNVMPTSSWSAFSSICSALRSLASSAPSGSSSSRTAGSGQRPRERDALLLAAGELVRAGASRSRSAGPAPAPRRPARSCLPCGDVLVRAGRTRRCRRRQVREQRVVLEHGVDVALVRRRLRHVDAVEQDLRPRSGARSRRSSAGSWSCRSRRGRAGRRTRPAGIFRLMPVDRREVAEALHEVDELDLSSRHARDYTSSPRAQVNPDRRFSVWNHAPDHRGARRRPARCRSREFRRADRPAAGRLLGVRAVLGRLGDPRVRDPARQPDRERTASASATRSCRCRRSS